MDLATGRMYSKEGREVDMDGQQSDVTVEERAVHLASQQSDVSAEPCVQGRHSTVVRSRRSNAESLPERYLVQVAEASAVPGPYSPPMPEFMVRAAISHEEFMRKNPTNGQAMKGPDRDKWLASDKEEEEQLTMPQKGRIGPVMKEIQRGEIPVGCKILPITKQRKIKSSGKYKSRYCVMGNLDDFNGPTYASTASKKIVWLLFALSTRLGLHTRFFDITGAFMHERPTRDIYVTVDGKFYILLYSLYGTKDAPKLFQDGLVVHLQEGGYVQSKWDQCLFYKWISVMVYIYIMFHVDDFDASGTSEEIKKKSDHD